MSGVCNDCHNHPCVCGMDQAGSELSAGLGVEHGGNSTRRGISYPNLWRLAYRDPKAMRELNRLSRLEETLELIARDGCGNASPLDPHDHRKGWETCAEKCPGEQDEWCWSCIARAELNA